MKSKQVKWYQWLNLLWSVPLMLLGLVLAVVLYLTVGLPRKLFRRIYHVEN